jgi:hypothetical protein
MDIQKIAHIGTETILFAGMFAYFHNQNKKLKQDNEELKEKVNSLQDVLNKQLNNVYVAMDNLKNNMIKLVNSRDYPLNKHAPGMKLTGKVSPKQQIATELKQRKKNVVIPDGVEQKNVNEIDTESTHNEDDLDNEISNELRELEEDEDDEAENRSKDMKTTNNNSKKKE